jgi:hypothetical protein
MMRRARPLSRAQRRRRRRRRDPPRTVRRRQAVPGAVVENTTPSIDAVAADHAPDPAADIEAGTSVYQVVTPLPQWRRIAAGDDWSPRRQGACAYRCGRCYSRTSSAALDAYAAYVCACSDSESRRGSFVCFLGCASVVFILALLVAFPPAGPAGRPTYGYALGGVLAVVCCTWCLGRTVYEFLRRCLFYPS